MGVLTDWQIENLGAITPFAPQETRPGVISYGVTSYGYDARIGYKFKVFSPIGATVVDPKNFDPKALVEVDLTPNRHEVYQTKPESMRDEKFWRCIYCGRKRDTQEEGAVLAGEVCDAREEKPDHILIPPHSFVLGETVETFKIPRDCLCVVLGKSTYARSGLVVNVTPLEPEWEGKVTVEISNTTPLPAKVYAGEGIMQVLFLRSDGVRYVSGEVLRNLIAGGSAGMVVSWKSLVEGYLSTSNTCRTSYADKKGKYQHQSGLTLPKVDGQ